MNKYFMMDLQHNLVFVYIRKDRKYHLLTTLENFKYVGGRHTGVYSKKAAQENIMEPIYSLEDLEGFELTEFDHKYMMLNCYGEKAVKEYINKRYEEYFKTCTPIAYIQQGDYNESSYKERADSATAQQRVQCVRDSFYSRLQRSRD